MSEPPDSEIATILQGGAAPAFTRTPIFVLTVVEGPDRGVSLRLDGTQPGRVLVGQSPACELRVTDPTVSRRHAAFDVVEQELHFSDLGSTNRSYAGGFAVVDAYLRGGENLHLGNTVIRVDRLEEARDVELPTATRFGRVVGASLEMRRLYPLCERIAASRIPVIIEGETGTGKEALAESLHETSKRASGPFVVFDCTAVPATLVEAELFGHERGAFTGALQAKPGLIESADGGTVFLDEIGEMPATTQAKLLRVLESGQVTRIGGLRPRDVDVRYVSATHRDLAKMVAKGTFRSDLLFRLDGLSIRIPPLRERTSEIGPLAERFVAEACREAGRAALALS